MANLFPDLTTYLLPTREFKHANAAPAAIVVLLFQRDNQKESLAFVEKILKSVGKTLQDTAILFMSLEEQVLFSQSRYYKRTNSLISFGPAPAQLGLNFLYRPYSPVHTSQCTYLFTRSLSTIQESQEDKKKLWSALKVMFP